jgi:hypothetical protein
MIIRGATDGLGLGTYNDKRSDMFRDTFYPGMGSINQGRRRKVSARVRAARAGGGLGIIDPNVNTRYRQAGVKLPDWDIGDFTQDVANTIKAVLPPQITQAPQMLSDKADEIKRALQISTGASLVAAAMAFLAYSRR